MEDKKYLVEVVCRQRALYEVEAADAEAAEGIAVERWQDGDPSDVTGFDWCELEATRATDAPDLERCRQDDEVLLRFIEGSAAPSHRPRRLPFHRCLLSRDEARS